ncbi:MAG: hypothetical protein K9L70_12480 [Thiohalocapsa sp.]|nr:hypothetical protein [Thiohalocapsa sp.]MCF7992255.1 hypothetical protein [Thiohalocapsa sp.]
MAAAAAVAVCALAGADALAQPETRREASDWLQLERDQRSYRERVEPLGLQEERRLEAIERGQRDDLRALQQRRQRELDSARRRSELPRQADPSPSPTPRPSTAVPRRDMFETHRRALERQRLHRRMQERVLPFER